MNTQITLIFFSLCIQIALTGQEHRSIDGRNNNLNNLDYGSAGFRLESITPIAFKDSISEPARGELLDPRAISNIIFHQKENILDQTKLSDFTWVFGQFLDHEISLVPNFSILSHPEEDYSMVVDRDDPFMQEGKIIPLMRSQALNGTGTDVSNPRAYFNEITAFIDGSAIYGSEENRAQWLRSYSGGKLKTSSGNQLPWNTISGEFNAPVDNTAPRMADDLDSNRKLYVAGDIRANENPLLLSIHTLFVREHNRLCQSWLDSDASLNPDNPNVDEMLYQRARSIVGAILQKIAYTDWLPSMGINLEDYSGYDEEIIPAVTNVFSAAAFRWGHSMVPNEIKRYNLDGSDHDLGHLGLKEAFFRPVEFKRSGLDPWLKGMGIQMQQNLDCQVVDAVRNFLFEENPVLGGLDLAAINIQRGRERGLADFNAIRQSLGLEAYNSFEEICSNTEVVQQMKEIYGEVDNIDPWVGMLAEDHQEGMMFGQTIAFIMTEQFRTLRDGDRFFYLNDSRFNEEDMALIRSSTLAELILRNSQIICLQENVFETTEHNNIPCWPNIFPLHLDLSLAPSLLGDEMARLNIFSNGNIQCDVYIIDNQGRTVMTLNRMLTKGENHLFINGENLPVSGVYHIVLESEDVSTSLKFVKI